MENYTDHNKLIQEANSKGEESTSFNLYGANKPSDLRYSNQSTSITDQDRKLTVDSKALDSLNSEKKDAQAVKDAIWSVLGKPGNYVHILRLSQQFSGDCD